MSLWVDQISTNLGWAGLQAVCLVCFLRLSSLISSYLIDVLLMVMTSTREQAQLCKLVSILSSRQIH